MLKPRNSGGASTPQVNADWTAASGVAQILNKPSIPAAQVQSDWSAVSGVSSILNKPVLFNGAYSSLTGIPSAFTPAAHNQAWNTITSTP